MAFNRAPSVLSNAATLMFRNRFHIRRNMSAQMLVNTEHQHHFNTLLVTSPKPFVYHVELHRPKHYNAMSKEMWMEFKKCFDGLAVNPDCRAIVVSGSGKHFCAGIDLNSVMKFGQELSEIDDIARKGLLLGRLIKLYQESFTSMELCPKPVIAAVHHGCIGAGVDMITAADIRYCTADAFFQVKEVDIGMAADVGSLQRFPKAIGSASLARELCLTGRRFESNEAHSCGLVNKVFPDKDSLLKGAIQVATTIAEKSPVAVQAIKKNLVYSQSRPNQEGLDQIREMNQLLMLSEDFANAAANQLTKGEKAVFSKL